MSPLLVDPDEYTKFMQQLQPEAETTPLVNTQFFEVPNGFRDDLVMAMKYLLKNKKSPEPDLIRIEVLKSEPGLFVDVALAL